MRKKNKQTLSSLEEPTMDNTFAFIAGHTPAGIPYGTTWEEIGIDPTLPFEEKKKLYAEGHHKGRKARPGLTPSHIADLKNIFATLSSIQTELATIGEEALNADISVAAETVGDAMGYIGDWLNMAESKIMYEDEVEIDEVATPVSLAGRPPKEGETHLQTSVSLHTCIHLDSHTAGAPPAALCGSRRERREPRCRGCTDLVTALF